MGMTKIQKVDLTTNASEINFTSIPATYKDLYLLLNVRNAASAAREQLNMTFNSNGAGYAQTRGYVYDSVPTFNGDNATSQSFIALGSANDTSVGSYYFSPYEIYIFSYASSYANKTAHARFGSVSNTSSNWVSGFGHYGWANTAAINSIRLYWLSNNFVAGSTATLYGIK